MEKPEAGCSQFVEDDLSVRIDKHPTSSFHMSNFHIVSLFQQPVEECCCGGVTGKKYDGSSVCLLRNLPRLFLFTKASAAAKSDICVDL